MKKTRMPRTQRVSVGLMSISMMNGDMVGSA